MRGVRNKRRASRALGIAAAGRLPPGVADRMVLGLMRHTIETRGQDGDYQPTTEDDSETCFQYDPRLMDFTRMLAAESADRLHAIAEQVLASTENDASNTQANRRRDLRALIRRMQRGYAS